MLSNLFSLFLYWTWVFITESERYVCTIYTEAWHGPSLLNPDENISSVDRKMGGGCFARGGVLCAKPINPTGISGAHLPHNSRCQKVVGREGNWGFLNSFQRERGKTWKNGWNLLCRIIFPPLFFPLNFLVCNQMTDWPPLTSKDWRVKMKKRALPRHVLPENKHVL